MIAFSFASRTFAYRTLERGVGRSLSAFSSFMRDYLDPVIKADQCAQNVDNIDIPATSPEQLIANLRVVFQCIQNAGLKLLMPRCHYGTTEFGFLGRTVTAKGVTQEKQKITKLLDKIKIPSSKESLQQQKYYRNHKTHLAETLNLFFQLLKATENKEKFIVTTELRNEFGQFNDVSSNCCL